MKWGEEQVKILRHYKEKRSESFQRIALVLSAQFDYDYTKNGVISKWRQLHPDKYKETTRSKSAVSGLKKNDAVPKTYYRPKTERDNIPFGFTHLSDLSKGMCHWPSTGGEIVEYVDSYYCGKACSGLYCEAHSHHFPSLAKKNDLKRKQKRAEQYLPGVQINDTA